MIITNILIPIVGGVILLLMPEWKNRKYLCSYTAVFLILTAFVTIETNMFRINKPITAFYLTKKLPILFRIDGVGHFFASVTCMVWVIAGIFAFAYMSHEQKEKRYYAFYLIAFGVLLGLDYAGNLVTFYLFYELMTLTTLPLVLHSRTKEAIMAGLKYLFFSFAGAYMVLFGIYFLNRYASSLSFVSGGVLDVSLVQGKEGLLLFVAFIMLLGFGVKAGMFPLHSWLPAAHPEAPAPASAALSGIIVKAGVLGAIRVVYYLFGVNFLRGTWVQEVWLILILVTILLGSMLAYREKGFKKRLAYSTVSQVSYILLGIAMMTQNSFTGAMLHTSAHAFTKCGLFLAAGAVIYRTGKTRVDELRGIGRRMPCVMVCFTIFSLSLIGIPPFSGFVSKWYLGIGCLSAKLPVFSVLAPAVLLISALLTAGYLLPIAINGFLPGEDYKEEPVAAAPMLMRVSLVTLALLVTLGGIFNIKTMHFIHRVVEMIFREVAG